MLDLGDVATPSVTVRDATGAPAVAGAITCTIIAPDGSTSTPTVTNVSTGVYSVAFPTTLVGRHTVRWVATGANASAFTDVFDVRASVSIQLFSLADARAMLNLQNTNNDEELRDYIDAATSAVEERVGAVVQRSVTEQVVARETLALSVVPVISITAINSTLIAGWPVDPAGLTVNSATGILRLTNRGRFYGDLYTITYLAGRNPVPPAISLAGRIILKHLWATQRGPTGRPGAQQDAMTPAQFGVGYSIPNAAEQLLAPYLSMSGIA